MHFTERQYGWRVVCVQSSQVTCDDTDVCKLVVTTCTVEKDVAKNDPSITLSLWRNP